MTALDDDGKPATRPVPFQAVPYSTWDNRQPGPMVVWLPEKPEVAEGASASLAPRGPGQGK